MENNSRLTFAVVIPNYNHAAYLPEALESVVTQSHQPAIIYVIDDASTDHSIEIIGDYVRRYSYVHFIRKERNCGALANINEILPRIQATHVLFLAADDYLYPGYFARAHALLSKHPNAGVCLADLVNVSPDGTQRRFSYGLSAQPAYFPPAQVSVVARGLGLMGQCLILVDGLRQIGGFPETLRWHSDHFVCWVLAARYGLCYVPQARGAFRKLPASYSAQGMSGSAHHQVFASFLDYLNRPEFADVKEALRDGHILAVFDGRLLSALWRDREHRYFLTPSFVGRLVRRTVRGIFRHPVPRPVKRWFRRQLRLERHQVLPP